MRAKFDMDITSFKNSIQVTISKVGTATKKATIEGAKEILQNSLEEVPKLTDTLAQSAYYEIIGSSKDFSAEIGYGGNGDPVNPSTGQKASEYAIYVHEDLEAQHPIGKAKYLEDPLKEYSKKFTRSYAKILQQFLGV